MDNVRRDYFGDYPGIIFKTQKKRKLKQGF
jgi:hypothetical protein